METTEQILTRQCAEFRFKDNAVEYFSISTQWDEANTIDEAVKNILQADKKYNGKASMSYWIENLGMHYEEMSCEEVEKIVDIFNSLPEIYPIFPEELEKALERFQNE